MFLPFCPSIACHFLNYSVRTSGREGPNANSQLPEADRLGAPTHMWIPDCKGHRHEWSPARTLKSGLCRQADVEPARAGDGAWALLALAAQGSHGARRRPTRTPVGGAELQRPSPTAAVGVGQGRGPPAHALGSGKRTDCKFTEGGSDRGGGLLVTPRKCSFWARSSEILKPHTAWPWKGTEAGAGGQGSMEEPPRGQFRCSLASPAEMPRIKSERPTDQVPKRLFCQR